MILSLAGLGFATVANAQSDAQPKAQAFAADTRPTVAWSHSEIPFEAVEPDGLRSPSELQFQRLTLYFSEPLAIRQLEMESCSGLWRDGVSATLNMGEWVVRAEGGTQRLTFSWSPANLKTRTVQSITIGFRFNRKPCLKSLRVRDLRSQPVALSLDRHLPSLSSQTFSQRTEWTSAQPIDGALLWYGDEPIGDKEGRSTSEMMLMGTDRVVTVPVRPGLQYVPIDPPHEKKVIAARQALASDLRGLVLLSANGAEAWRANAREGEPPKVDTGSGFLRQLLHQDLVSHDDKGLWVLRLRVDGSFYIRGEDDRRGVGRLFGAVGRYTVQVNDDRSVRLLLLGHRLKGRSDADIPACAEDCLPRATSAKRDRKSSISEEIEIDRSGAGGQLMLRNRSPRTEREFDFTDMRVRLGHADL
jgi:hypothetical protein